MLSKLEKKLIQDISPGEAWKHVEHLSKLDKTSGTKGEDQAHEYVRSKLDEYGVKYDTYTFNSLISHPIDSSLTVVEPLKEKIESRPAAFGAKVDGRGIVAELVYVNLPEGTLFGGLEGLIDLYKEADVKGKIPIVWGLAAPTVMFAAQEAGSLAQVHIGGEEVIHEMIVTTIWGTPTPESAERLPKIPALSIKRSDGEKLLEALKKEKVKVRVTSNVDTKWRNIPITVARVEGNDAPEKFMLVHGHMDSWYLGTTDNCTGNAACLELCRVFQKNRGVFKRSLKVAWWSGHSTGRYSGSTWYADSQYDDLNRNCFITMNIDSPGVKGATEVGGGGLMGTPRFISEVIRDATGLEKFRVHTRHSRAGDQSFYGIGIPSIGASGHIPRDSPHAGVWIGGSGGGWWWHSPEDTIDKGDKDNLHRDVKMQTLAISRLLNCEVLPFDFSGVADEYITAIKDVQEKTVVEKEILKTTYNKIQKMKAAALSLNEALKTAKPSDMDSKNVNECMEKIAKILTSTLYTYYGKYDQDPAYNMGLIPLLRPATKSTNPSEDKVGFLKTRVMRNANKVNDEIDTATGLMEDVIKICKK